MVSVADYKSQGSRFGYVSGSCQNYELPENKWKGAMLKRNGSRKIDILHCPNQEYA